MKKESAFSMSAKRREMLAAMMKKEGVKEVATVERIPLRAPDAPLVMSYAQQRLWFLDRLETGKPTYNIPLVLRLQGKVDHTAMQHALTELVERHETLRTTFVEVSGETRTQIGTAGPFDLPVIDLRLEMATDRAQKSEQIIWDETQHPFDLTTGPLLRGCLLLLDEGDARLVLTIHHIISDGWSNGQLLQQLSALYTAFVQGQPAALPPLPIQYSDFALWQQQWLQGDVLTKQLAYWRNQLADSPELLELPSDRLRPSVPTYRGELCTAEIAPPWVERLELLGNEEGSRLFMTLLALFQTFLYRYSGQHDVPVGTPIAGRTRKEVQELIGLFANTLVMRTDLSGQPTFRELLRRVREVALGAYANQDLPFEKLVEEINPNRNLSYNPLFQMMFILRNREKSNVELPALTMSLDKVERGTSKVDLTLEVVHDKAQNTLHVQFEYNTDLFDASTAERMLQHFMKLVEAAALQPDLPIDQLPMLPANERDWLLNGWQQLVPESQIVEPMHVLFEQQAARTPDAVAVVFEDQQLTYAELNARANQIAAVLRERGALQETKVGICMERSLQLLCGLLGIWKAGGAYVPLDPDYPAERLALIVEDAEMGLLLTTEPLLEWLPVEHVEVICLDRDLPLIEQAGTDNLPLLTEPEHLAYVIYTSGSTGKPKGVLVEHRNVMNFFTGMNDLLLVDERDTLLAVTSVCFDISVLELFWTLTHGVKVVVLKSTSDDLSPYSLQAQAERHAATLLQCTPSLMKMTSKEALRSLHPLRVLLLGGEALSVAQARELRDALPEVRLLNMYGPTEATVWATSYDVQADEQRIPIGRPLLGARAIVLDPQMTPVPVGVPGELHIGGASVVRGYHKRPELTAERFVRDPFSTQPDDRLYKTGDLVRLLPAGDIEFLGRIDQQVKLRGFRIELGEVEAVLQQHPDIAETAVLVREDGNGMQQLVAYVVKADSATISIPKLRQFVKEKLPDYMVPHVFMELAEMPLTLNGKLDRKALPLPERMASSDNSYVAPREPMEELLAAIFADVLQMERVGIHDSFFQLGGHSLLILRLIARVDQVLGVRLPMRAVFEGPTVAALADCVRDLRQQQQGATEAPLQAQAREQPLPLSYAQQRLWFVDQMQPDNAAYNMTLGMRLTGMLDLHVLQRVLESLVHRHEALRTVFVTEGRDVVQKQLPPAPFAWDFFDLSELYEEDARVAAVHEVTKAAASKPFQLATDLLFRATLLKLSDTEHLLLIVTHHIVFDGSAGIFRGEFARLYKAFVQGLPSPLPELPIQYADFAYWQRQWLAGPMLETELSYWREQLSGSLAPLELPIAKPRPPVQSFRGQQKGVRISKTLTDRLNDLSRQEGATLFMTVLAAFQTLLYRYSGQEDILVGTPIAGRNRPELEHLVGCLVNTLVLRTTFHSEWSVRDLIQQVRQTTLGAYDHQNVPFQVLVETLQPTRDSSHTPLFQVMFTLGHADNRELALPDLQVEAIGFASDTSRFDLLFGLVETADGLVGSIEYNTDLFDEMVMTRFVAHFETLLQAMVDQPDQQVLCLPLMTAEEHGLLVVENNATDGPTPTGLLHSGFLQQAQHAPERVAVITSAKSLTYGELLAGANPLGQELRERGVQRNTLVAIVMEKGWEQVVAVLGILQAGAAYLPIDPKLPQERIDFLLQQGEVQVVVTQPWVNERLTWPEGISTLVVTEAQIHAQVEPQPLLPVQQQDDLAYVIFTSGSTGVPKGVAINHRGALNTICDINDRFGVGAEDRVLALSSLSFDLSVYDIFGLLQAGGALVIPDAEGVYEPSHWAELMCRERVTVWNSVPPLLKLLLEHVNDSPAEEPLALRLSMLSGDWIPLHLPAQLRQWVPDVQVVSLGGATEASIWSILYPISTVEAEWKSIPYGLPMRNQRFYVLNDAFEPCPIGVPGHLYIGGIGLAKEYWRDPQKTAASFLTHPLTGERLYRTGDMGCYRSDGVIEFLGRLDNQVKIRGFRIELGEIEAVLRQHPATEEALVMAVGDVRGDKRLVAYLTSVDVQTPHASELRHYLKEKLPDYMVPASFIWLDALPLTPNGKVDRKALPTPDFGAVDVEKTHVAPRDWKEELLVTAWEQTLGRSYISVDDNFFELGGDSILAIQVIAKAQRLGLKLTASDMIRNQTIREQAEVATQVGERQLVATEWATGEVPLTPIQRGFFAQELAVPQHWNQARLLEIRADTDAELLQQALQQTVAAHDAFRLRYERRDNGWMQQLHDQPASLSITRVDLSGYPAEEQTERLLSDVAQRQQSLDLGAAPLVCAVLYDFGAEQSGRLLLVMHHLIVDAVSWQIVLDDVVTIYEQALRGETSALIAETMTYRTWTLQLQEQANQPSVAAEADFWLSSARANVAPLPRSLETGENVEASADTVSLVLSTTQTTDLLKKVVPAARMQLHELLLAALAEGITDWSGHPSCLINIEGHGREERFAGQDLSRTVGWFTAIYPLLLERHANMDRARWLKAVKEQLRSVPNHGIGYGLLRYVCTDTELSRRMRELPDAEISFNYLGQFRAGHGQRFLNSAQESIGNHRNEQGKRPHLLDITAFVSGDSLHVNLTYSRNCHVRAEIEGMLQRVADSLQGLIDVSQAGTIGGFTPSDFPLAMLTQQDVDHLHATYPDLVDLYPLTVMQEQMLHQRLTHSQPGMYVICNEYSLRDIELDRLAFERAWQTVVSRHAVLRTAFAWRGLETPLQVVRATRGLKFEFHDLRDLSEQEQSERVQTMVRARRVHNFNLDGEQMEMGLFQVGERAYEFVWLYNYMILDGWSTNRVFQEFLTCYEAYSQGAEWKGTAPTHAFSDLIAWQQAQDQESARHFWQGVWQGINALTPLVPEQATNEMLDVAEVAGHLKARDFLPPELAANLQQFARDHHLTLSNLVEGAWALLLSRYSGEERVVFGITMSGRPSELAGIREIVGNCVNILPLVVPVRSQATLLDWLRDIQLLQTEVAQYEYTSPKLLHEWLGLAPSGELFDSYLVLQNFLKDKALPLQRQKIWGTPQFRNTAQTDHPLRLEVTPGEWIALSLNYDGTRFSSAWAESVLHDLRAVLERMQDAPACTVGDLVLAISKK